MVKSSLYVSDLDPEEGFDWIPKNGYLDLIHSKLFDEEFEHFGEEMRKAKKEAKAQAGTDRGEQGAKGGGMLNALFIFLFYFLLSFVPIVTKLLMKSFYSTTMFLFTS